MDNINNEETLEQPEVIYLYNRTLLEDFLAKHNSEKRTIKNFIKYSLSKMNVYPELKLLQCIMFDKNNKNKPKISAMMDQLRNQQENELRSNTEKAKISKSPKVKKKKQSNTPNIAEPLTNAQIDNERLKNINTEKKIHKIITSFNNNNTDVKKENDKINNNINNNNLNNETNNPPKQSNDQLQDKIEIPLPIFNDKKLPNLFNETQSQNRKLLAKKTNNQQEKRLKNGNTNKAKYSSIFNSSSKTTNTKTLSTTAQNNNFGVLVSSRPSSIANNNISQNNITTTNSQNQIQSSTNNNNKTNNEQQNQNNNDKNKQTSYIAPIVIGTTGAGAIIGGVLLRNNKIALILLCASGGVLILCGTGVAIKKSLSKNQQPQNNLGDVNNIKGNSNNKNL